MIFKNGYIIHILYFISFRSLKGKSIKSSNPPEKEQRRKKLNKRSKVLGRIKTKAIVQYSPSEDDIAQLLKEFTVDFLLNGNHS